MAKSKSTSIVSQEASEAVKERLKRLNDLESKNRAASIDQTSSDEDNDKVSDVVSLERYTGVDGSRMEYFRILKNQEHLNSLHFAVCFVLEDTPLIQTEED